MPHSVLVSPAVGDRVRIIDLDCRAWVGMLENKGAGVVLVHLVYLDHAGVPRIARRFPEELELLVR